MQYSIATRVITSPFPTPMGGYGASQDLFDEAHASLSFTDILLRLTPQLSIIGLNAKPLRELGRKLKAVLGRDKSMVLGYTNRSMAYVPDTEELKRGGYEAEAYIHENLTGPFLPGIENRLAAAIQNHA